VRPVRLSDIELAEEYLPKVEEGSEGGAGDST
jgi:hypothetical protein